MSKFLHTLSDAKGLFELIGDEKNLRPAIVEKDYWIMHCLWGLQQSGLQFEMKGGTSLSKGWCIIERFSEDIDIRFDAPAQLNTKGDRPSHIEARFAFYDDLAKRIKIPGIIVERNREYDDPKAQNGGINLKYESCFPAVPELRKEVLLEVGFDKTAPNEPCDFSSWALDRALDAKIAVINNRALGVKCFNPEYTFVDKLQTICRRFRQHRERNDPEKDKPRHFLRHYYDLYMLLGVKRVREFIGTAEYESYKKQKLRTTDAKEFGTRDAFTLKNAGTYELFDREFEVMSIMLMPPRPKFSEIIKRIREQAPDF
ncbi:MAG: nucleotidyl transferase AbiEii/AbiGii toxin family protein [Elusimicrobia bacterium]|nr:nucleotidyl transferase AbiEii/AbiGii toxin family protein [Elusimicrobiota bacterium]